MNKEALYSYFFMVSYRNQKLLNNLFTKFALEKNKTFYWSFVILIKSDKSSLNLMLSILTYMWH